MQRQRNVDNLHSSAAIAAINSTGDHLWLWWGGWRICSAIIDGERHLQ
jgi:hypothetical protein